MRLIKITVLVMLLPSFLLAQERGTFVDTRDNQTYQTIVLNKENPITGNNIEWMSENLKHFVDSKSSFSYNDSEVNLSTYGLLYTFKAATKACPSGWHLPTYDDWQWLFEVLGNDEITIGGQLKSKNGWPKKGGGSDKIGFKGLPGGYRNSSGMFSETGSMGAWWSSDKSAFGIRSSMNVILSEPEIDINKSAYSIRCVKD
jgi:uncharacterized protein (TIGR02145 family)